MQVFRAIRPFRLLLFVCLLSLPLYADETAEPRSAAPAEPHTVENVLLLRTGERLNSPHVVTYHMLEWSQQRGRWILPDVGYWDSGYGGEQQWFAGGGATLVARRHFHWDQEVYFAQEAGPRAHNQRSLWIWPVLDFTMPHRLSLQAVMYPTIPLNAAQRWGLDVDRMKLERNGSKWKYGAGYAASKYGDSPWHNKPFLTITRKSRMGSFEGWLERMPGGAQVQMRYLLVVNEH